MSIYNFIRQIRHQLAYTFGFSFALLGFILAVKLIYVDSYHMAVPFNKFLGLASPYWMLLGYFLPLFFFFNRGKTGIYYMFAGIGFIVALLVSLLDLFNVCDCVRAIEEEGLTVCQWSVILFLGMIVLKKLE